MDILDDMGVSKLSANVFFKVNYSFKVWTFCQQIVRFHKNQRQLVQMRINVPH